MSYIARFAEDRYVSTKTKMNSHRIDDFIRMVEQRPGRNKGSILAFVRGLRLSALLIYAIRDILSDTPLSAYWGQIIDEGGLFLSNECDIIICPKDSYEMKWNGDGKTNESDIMDYRFINKDVVRAVISCKSNMQKSDVEVDYYDNLSEYVEQIWLFAECCGPRSHTAIKNHALAIGYSNFWYLYRWSRTSGDTIDALDEWKNFEAQIRSLA